MDFLCYLTSMSNFIDEAQIFLRLGLNQNVQTVKCLMSEQISLYCSVLLWTSFCFLHVNKKNVLEWFLLII